ncbi:MAG: recombinase family protein [Burkholderiales bacterium]|nr:recombinase family protein [Burkholderiales bacterium]
MSDVGFVAYYRVSTQKQGLSGLGLDAQRTAVSQYLLDAAGSLLGEFTEIETGKGGNPLAKRPQLRAALDECKKRRAVLVIAKLDRLARNVFFVSGLMESRVRFIACDMPEANELTIHIMAAFAEHEAKRISERTKDALACAKARGVRLGRNGPANLLPNTGARKAAARVFAGRLLGQIDGFLLRGLTQREMVAEMNALGITAPRGGLWSLLQIQRVIHTLEANRAS